MYSSINSSNEGFSADHFCSTSMIPVYESSPLNRYSIFGLIGLALGLELGLVVIVSCTDCVYVGVNHFFE